MGIYISCGTANVSRWGLACRLTRYDRRSDSLGAFGTDWAVINGSEYLCGWGQGRAYGDTGEARTTLSYLPVPVCLSSADYYPGMISLAECYLHRAENQRPVIWDEDVESIR